MNMIKNIYEKEQNNKATEKQDIKEFKEKLENILQELIDKRGIEIYGNTIKIEVGKFDKLAFIKGATIYVDIKAKNYPEHVLKYIIAHELAHLVVRNHTPKFYMIVKMIYPEYEHAREELFRILNIIKK
ncbi:MAG: YgjP-like metallopeptidase domain-containing protein [Thermoplasmata archaeon]